MRALRLFLLTVLVATLVAGTAYGAGRAYRQLGDESASSSPTGSGEPAPVTSPTTTPSTAPSTPETTAPVEPVEPPKPAAVLEPGAKGEQVRELQHRLFQMAWLPETTTGRYDTTTKEAVAGFQGKRGFKATGVVDKKTWTKLVAMTRTPTHDQKFNVLKPGPALLATGASGDAVRDAQARLKQIAWLFGDVTGTFDAKTVAAVKGFQAKRAIPVTGEVDQRTWDRLTAMTRTPTSDEKHNRTPKPSAAGLDSRCMTGRAMCISKSTNSLVWVVDGKPQMRMDVRFGSQELPTREGSFSVGWKSRKHVSTIYHTPMPYAMFFSGGQAVHYSPDFAARGYNGASHGCVNVRNLSGIQWLFDEVRNGDKVIVYR